MLFTFQITISVFMGRGFHWLNAVFCPVLKFECKVGKNGKRWKPNWAVGGSPEVDDILQSGCRYNLHQSINQSINQSNNHHQSINQSLNQSSPINQSIVIKQLSNIQRNGWNSDSMRVCAKCALQNFMQDPGSRYSFNILCTVFNRPYDQHS